MSAVPIYREDPAAQRTVVVARKEQHDLLLLLLGVLPPGRIGLLGLRGRSLPHASNAHGSGCGEPADADGGRRPTSRPSSSSARPECEASICVRRRTRRPGSGNNKMGCGWGGVGGYVPYVYYARYRATYRVCTTVLRTVLLFREMYICTIFTEVAVVVELLKRERDRDRCEGP